MHFLIKDKFIFQPRPIGLTQFLNSYCSQWTGITDLILGNWWININGKNYDVECNDGEENLLKQSVELINDKIEKRNDLKNLPDSKMFMLISLIFAGDLITLKQKIKITDKELDIVDEELDKLKNYIKKNE